MKWELKEPVYGDVIKVKAGSIYHYGIYVNDDEVIQFGLSPLLRKDVPDSDVEVCSSNIDDFLVGGFLEVGVPEKKDPKRFPPKKTVTLAMARLGEKGYNIIYNNCEHFAHECYFGEKFSSQTDSIRELFKTLPIVDVYVAEIPEQGKIEKVYPNSRQNEIKEVNNEKVKREKYYAWKLLEYGLKRSFGKKITDVKFQKQNSGKWTCNFCEFSISHSYNAVCVAISRSSVGVDIEKIQAPKIDISNEILSQEELIQYSGLSSEEKITFVINAWTKKESLFKSKNIKNLTREEFAQQNGTVFQKVIYIKDEPYSLCIATNTPEKIKLYEVNVL